MAVLTSFDLKAVAAGGLLREDVMDKIWDISKIPLPFTDMIGDENASQEYTEWTQDTLAEPDITNARIDGSDASGNDTTTGARVGNHCQISDKKVMVSYRADASKKIGRAKELGYQLMRKQQELKRDMEAIMLTNQASVADNGTNTAGKLGGLPAWIETAHVNGTAGGFNTSTKIVDARTPGARLTLTETIIRNVVETVYENGGNPSVLMSKPAVIRKISEYLFTSSARIATVMSDLKQDQVKAAAIGAFNIFVTDFCTLKLVPNRLQRYHKDSGGTLDCADVFILDPSYLACSKLEGMRTETLAKTGLAEKRQMSVDYTLIVHTEKAHGLIGDVNHTAQMTF